MQFPIFKTKVAGVAQIFDLNDIGQRQAYFEAKAGPELKKLREYLKENTFITYLLGKKNAGKGTYSKMFKEVVDKERIDHLSIGDIVREVDEIFKSEEKKKELITFLERNYRGYISISEAISVLEKRSTKTLLPSELILALVKREIAQREKRALFIDGFPRNLDQISYSLFFRDLIGYRDDPDVFILIDVPENVINERIKYRVVCPQCHTPRNLKLHLAKEIRYDEKNKEFYFICGNSDCQGIRMIPKEGDELGIKPIRERLKMDEKLIERAFSLHGIPRILLRNSIPIEIAKNYVDDYEITPEYFFQWNEKIKKVEVIKTPWVISDDEGIPSYNLLPSAMVVSLIKQMVEVLNL